MGDAVMLAKLRAFFGVYALPPDYVGWAGVAVAALCLLAAVVRAHPFNHWLELPRRHGPARIRFVMSASFAAAFLSLGYVAHYLGGGPRIIDATTYFLEGRTLAQGSFTFDILEPTASFRGRFLLFSEPHQLGGIFPPGYPALLAFGFLIGAPMVIGPLLAAAITGATYFLALEIGEECFQSEEVREAAARGAALLSVVNAALRYHTADTMAHGAAALALTCGLYALLRARRTEEQNAFSLLGLSLGWLVATRPVSALPLLVLALIVGVRSKRIARVAIYALPGIALLIGSQAAVAGSWIASTQKAYYAVSDGPPGCFRYGFGAGVGCLFEHGDFVRAQLPDGFGLVPALGTTLRRLKLHLLDASNWEFLTLALFALTIGPVRRFASARLAAIVVVGQIVAYLPFYFDGSYPGGGARFYADILPVEHALFAVALAHRFPTFTGASRGLALTIAIGALAFAFHTVHGHVALKEMDGGRPMFEPDLVREAHKDHGLIFFDSDHGFNLALQPGLAPSHGVTAVRRRNDDRDRYLYDVLGRPSTHRYVFGKDKSTLENWAPPSSGTGVYRFEGEAEWPPLGQRGGWIEPAWASGITSNDRYLRLSPTELKGAMAEIELLVPGDGRYSVDPTVVLENVGVHGKVEVLTKGAVVLTWEWDDPSLQRPDKPGTKPSEITKEKVRPRTQDLGQKTAELASPARIRLHLVGGPGGLDKVMLRKQ